MDESLDNIFNCIWLNENICQCEWSLFTRVQLTPKTTVVDLLSVWPYRNRFQWKNTGVLFQENAFDVFFCNCVVVLNLSLYMLIISLILQITGILLSRLTKSGRDIGMVSIRPCVRASVRLSVCPSLRDFLPLSGNVITQFISNLM